jgi:hypothetical protein
MMNLPPALPHFGKLYHVTEVVFENHPQAEGQALERQTEAAQREASHPNRTPQSYGVTQLICAIASISNPDSAAFSPAEMMDTFRKHDADYDRRGVATGFQRSIVDAKQGELNPNHCFVTGEEDVKIAKQEGFNAILERYGNGAKAIPLKIIFQPMFALDGAEKTLGLGSNPINYLIRDVEFLKQD